MLPVSLGSMEIILWTKQIIYYALGAIAISVLLYFDLEQLEKLSLYVFLFGILLLLILKVSPESIAPVKNGAKSWFQFGSVTLQPSEFMKIGLMMMVASVISKASPKKSVRSEMMCIFCLRLQVYR